MLKRDLHTRPTKKTKESGLLYTNISPVVYVLCRKTHVYIKTDLYASKETGFLYTIEMLGTDEIEIYKKLSRMRLTKETEANEAYKKHPRSVW